MSYQHAELAAGRWAKLPFVEQLAHVGSEVERAIAWRAKQHPAYSQQAFERALELLDLTLQHADTRPRRKEVALLRETLVDDFAGTNQYHSTDAAWRNYFACFTYAARKDR
jgi:hypothetical protein